MALLAHGLKARDTGTKPRVRRWWRQRRGAAVEGEESGAYNSLVHEPEKVQSSPIGRILCKGVAAFVVTINLGWVLPRQLGATYPSTACEPQLLELPPAC